MDQHNATPDTQERSSVGRRTVLKGAAWSVPVVAVVGATPAFAKTGDTVTFTYVTVNTAPPTGVPSNYINISNKDSTVTVGGKVTSGAAVTVTFLDYSKAATTNGTDWYHTILANDLPQGTLSFTASVAGPPVVSKPGPNNVVKDTVAPILTHGQISYSGNQGGSVSGMMGLLAAPPQGTPDTKSVSFSWVTKPSNVTGSLTQNATTGAWTFTWGTSTGNAKGLTIAVKIAQSDGAGNVTEVPFTWNVPA